MTTANGLGRVRRTAARVVAIGVAVMVGLFVAGADASADHFSNSTIDDVDFGPAQATGGSDLDSNVAEFDLGIYNLGGFFGYSATSDGSVNQVYGGSSYGRYVYSFRSINGSFSNSNEAGTKSVFIEWLMTEPDTTRRSLYGVTVQQKHDVVLRVTLYTTGGYTTQTYTELEDCAVTATARSDRDSEDPTSVRIQLKCKRDALANMGFTEDQIDCIEEALETRSHSMRYIWRAGD